MLLMIKTRIDSLPEPGFNSRGMIPLNEAPSGYAQFDAGAPVKFVIDPHGMVKAA